MRSGVLFAMFAAILLVVWTAAFSQIDDRAIGHREYSIVYTRNIFDPERRPSRPSSGTEVQATPTPAPQVISLLGTWVTESSAGAILDSERAEFRGTRKRGDALAGWEIARIDTEKLVLSRNDETIEWPVGSQISRTGEGEWRVSGSAPRGATSTRSSSQGSSNISDSAAADILRRLRERRQRETGNE